LLSTYGVNHLVDVRSFPGSKYCPQWNAQEIVNDLPDWLQYGRIPELGGKRKASSNSINAAWRNASFRGYADYMQTDDFRRGVDDLLEVAEHDVVAIMCAEAVWWKCHRHMIGDYLTGMNICEVRNIMDNGASVHKLTDFAVVENTVFYPVTEA
jgi:uncharacterized protein (DUF488 family)